MVAEYALKKRSVDESDDDSIGNPFYSTHVQYLRALLLSFGLRDMEQARGMLRAHFEEQFVFFKRKRSFMGRMGHIVHLE